MTIYELLKKDHRTVKGLFKKLKKAKGEEAKTIFNDIKAELIVHATAEEECFYAPLRTASQEEGEELAWEGKEEHHVVALLLNELAVLQPDTEAWTAKVTVLEEMIDHHVEEEESEIFSAAREVFSTKEAQDMAKEMKTLKMTYEVKIPQLLKKHVELFKDPKKSESF